MTHVPTPPYGPGMTPPEPPKGPVPGIVSVVFGLLGVILPFSPVDLSGVRAYVALGCGLAGLVLAVVGLAGNRGGKPVAAAGAILAVLVLALGAYMVVAGV